MAKSWADMSKEERQDAGGNKKSYNQQTGQERYAVGGQLEHKSALYNPDSAGNQTNQNTQNTQNNQSASASSSTSQNNQSAASEARSRAQSHISSKNEGHATEKQYRGPDGKMYTGKEADDAGWSPGYYDEGGGAYVPDKPTFDDPDSDEAISARLQYYKDTRKGGKYEEGMQYLDKNDARRVYDSSSSINEGYDRNLTAGEKGREWWMGRQYMQDMRDQGHSWNAGEKHAYDFNGEKGIWTPKASTRQQRAMEYDKLHTNDPSYLVSESKRQNLGNRYDYIHRTFDPLNGKFKFNEQYT